MDIRAMCAMSLSRLGSGRRNIENGPTAIADFHHIDGGQLRSQVVEDTPSGEQRSAGLAEHDASSDFTQLRCLLEYIGIKTRLLKGNRSRGATNARADDRDVHVFFV